MNTCNYFSFDVFLGACLFSLIDHLLEMLDTVIFSCRTEKNRKIAYRNHMDEIKQSCLRMFEDHKSPSTLARLMKTFTKRD